MFEVCVIDDEDGIVDLCKDALAPHFSVKTFTSPIEALETFKQGSLPGLILTDIKMPVMDGFSLCENLRNFNPNIPIVMMSAYADKHHVLRAIDEKFEGFIEKPFELDNLRTTIADVIRRNQLQLNLKKMVDEYQLLCGAQQKLVVSYCDRLKSAEDKIFQAGIDSEMARASVGKFLGQIQYQRELEREITRLSARIEDLSTSYSIGNIASMRKSNSLVSKKTGTDFESV